MSLRRRLRAESRDQEAKAATSGTVGPFVVEEWLARLPASYATRPEWSTPAEHERHRRDRAYLMYLKARREAQR